MTTAGGATSLFSQPWWQKAVRIAGWAALVVDVLGLVGAGILRWVESPCNPDLFALTLLLTSVVAGLVTTVVALPLALTRTPNRWQWAAGLVAGFAALWVVTHLVGGCFALPPDWND